MDKFNELKKLQKNAYCKYSNFKVAAIVETEIGEFKGVNVENAAFGDTICAERSAICSAISNGAQQIIKIYLLTDGLDCNISTPCGACRQVMSEFMNIDSEIVVYDQNQNFKIFTVGQLLPNSFNLK